jgi:molecular chaperone GrpE
VAFTVGDDDIVGVVAVARDQDLRSLATALNELEAAKRRVERDAQTVSNDMRKQLIEKLLPVLDNLDRTIAAAEAAGDSPSVVEGVGLVRSQLEGVLLGYGLERFESLGAEFSPAFHDAVATVPAPPEQRERVIEQLAPGYLFNGALLRPASVVVGK